MIIRSAGESRLVLALSAEDLQELDITYEAMDYATIETRRVIWTVLDRAGKLLNRELDPSRRMLIEAAPAEDGGCTLSFQFLSGRSSNPTRLKKQSRSVLCEFNDAESLFAAARALASQPVPLASSLYAQSGKYRLLLTAPIGLGSARCLLREYCSAESTEPLAQAYTREHWRLLAEGDALRRILPE